MFGDEGNIDNTEVLILAILLKKFFYVFMVRPRMIMLNNLNFNMESWFEWEGKQWEKREFRKNDIWERGPGDKCCRWG